MGNLGPSEGWLRNSTGTSWSRLRELRGRGREHALPRPRPGLLSLWPLLPRGVGSEEDGRAEHSPQRSGDLGPSAAAPPFVPLVGILVQTCDVCGALGWPLELRRWIKCCPFVSRGQSSVDQTVTQTCQHTTWCFWQTGRPPGCSTQESGCHLGYPSLEGRLSAHDVPHSVKGRLTWKVWGSYAPLFVDVAIRSSVFLMASREGYLHWKDHCSYLGFKIHY